MKANSDTWLRWKCAPLDAAANMAWDEALLVSAPQRNLPLIRFYGWSEPAASFGYFQKYDEIARVTLLRPLVRRPTGGGLVPHAEDWTYSVAIPPGHEWYQLRAEASYERMHVWIRNAFQQLGVPAELAMCCRKEIPGQCFAGYEKHDVLLHSRKIAGAAQRRTKHGLLIQGSVQPPPAGITREAWEIAMLTVNAVAWTEFKDASAVQPLVEQLRTERYAAPDYNRRR